MLVVPLYELPVDTITGSVGVAALLWQLVPPVLHLKLGVDLCIGALQDDVTEKGGEIAWEFEGCKKGATGIASS